MQRNAMVPAAACLASLVLLLTGCGESDGDAEPARTVTATVTRPGTPETSPTSPTPTGEEESTGPVRRYPGAEVVTDATGFTMLRTDDSVEKVGDFYLDLMEDEDWDIVSKYEGDTSVHILARKGGDGLTVQVSPTGDGTSVSLSYYRV